MPIPNKPKLLAKKKLQAVKANIKFKINLQLEKLHFNLPTKMQLLKIAAGVALGLIMKEVLGGGVSEEENKKFLRSDPTARSIMSFTANDASEEDLSDILVACHNGQIEKLPPIDENLDGDSILENVSGMNDIDKKSNKSKIQKLRDKIANDLKKLNALGAKLQGKLNALAPYLAAGIAIVDAASKIKAEKERLKQQKEQIQRNITTYKHIIQHTVQRTKEIAQNTDHPSVHRSKHTQRLLRNLYGLIKEEYEKAKNSVGKEIAKQYEGFLKAIKKIDDILIALALMSALYIINRKLLAKRSRQTLKEVSADLICGDVPEPEEDTSTRRPFTVTLTCPPPSDVVPRMPVSEKIKNLSCEVPQNAEQEVNNEAKEDLATIAIIKNDKKDQLHYLVTKDSYVTQRTQIANIGKKTPLYSPVNGYVENIATDQIVIRDISEPVEDYLTSQVNLLNEKYEKLNNVKSFLKYFYVRSLYPTMIVTATLDDASTHSTANIPLLTAADEFTSIKKQFSIVEDRYEKAIKRITGRPNVELHAKMETLDKIKEEVEKEEKIFYLMMKTLGQLAVNKSKTIKVTPAEYALFDYYALDLGLALNALTTPNALEIEFMNTIKGYLEKRYVLDKASKAKIGSKIGIVMVELTGMTSPIGDDNAFADQLWQQTLDKYKSIKSLPKLKTWLTGLANKNKKLSDKTGAVNKVMYLFELYLNADSYVKKYSKIAKETTSKRETLKEGAYIEKYMTDAWNSYRTLLKEIQEVEDVIASLSMLATFSITTYNGEQAKLYTLSDDTECNSAEKDPYLNPKSKYGYGDIQYWQRYCSFATLASATSPGTGWSTGWIFPNPIMFPVIYIPKKAISTKYGFIVIGITICGIYIFPWILYANLSLGFVPPFGDPTAALKAEIQGLKKNISIQIAGFKKSLVKPLVEKAKANVDELQEKVDTLKSDLKRYRTEKPQKTKEVPETETAPTIDPSTNKSKAEDKAKKATQKAKAAQKKLQKNLNYAKELKAWSEKLVLTNKDIVTTSVKLWQAQVKYNILKDIYETGAGVKGVVQELDDFEASMKKKLDQLNTLVDNMSLILAALPYVLCPDTANFGITAKNPQLIIPIATELDDNINAVVLDAILEKFKIKNKDMLSPTFAAKIGVSAVNIKDFKQAISKAILVIIKKDAFPKYESLKLTNLAWVGFLYLEFVPKGAQTYGFPGFPPIPLP